MLWIGIVLMPIRIRLRTFHFDADPDPDPTLSIYMVHIGKSEKNVTFIPSSGYRTSLHLFRQRQRYRYSLIIFNSLDSILTFSGKM